MSICKHLDLCSVNSAYDAYAIAVGQAGRRRNKKFSGELHYSISVVLHPSCFPPEDLCILPMKIDEKRTPN